MLHCLEKLFETYIPICYQFRIWHALQETWEFSKHTYANHTPVTEKNNGSWFFSRLSCSAFSLRHSFVVRFIPHNYHNDVQTLSKVWSRSTGHRPPKSFCVRVRMQFDTMTSDCPQESISSASFHSEGTTLIAFPLLVLEWHHDLLNEFHLTRTELNGRLIKGEAPFSLNLGLDSLF